MNYALNNILYCEKHVKCHSFESISVNLLLIHR